MSHKRERTVYQHIVRLSSDDDDEQFAHEYIADLAKSNRASDWLRKVVVDAVKREVAACNGGGAGPGTIIRATLKTPIHEEPQYVPPEDIP